MLCAFGAAWPGASLPGPHRRRRLWRGRCSSGRCRVEGIVEGTDGWALALWLWAVGRGRVGWGALAFALTALSSWYMAATACLLAPFLGRVGLVSAAGGLVLSAPALGAFLGAFPARAPLDPAVRAAMGTTFGVAAPGVMSGLNPFAQTSWIGVLAPILALVAARSRPWVVVALLICALLSFGLGPWFELPPLSALRFPYRLHAGTLAALALLAGTGVERLGLGRWMAPLLVAEGLLLSPIEPVLPGARPMFPRSTPSCRRETCSSTSLGLWRCRPGSPTHLVLGHVFGSTHRRSMAGRAHGIPTSTASAWPGVTT
ncbi:MAG: hypothetical protein IPI35_18435 [Deltaproteobacteria bacterium]|nr:hypothetical protein [Deltaproteobacteria bacterium]